MYIGKTLEFKLYKSRGQSDVNNDRSNAIKKSLFSMAHNSGGGKIYFGINDQNQIIGINNQDLCPLGFMLGVLGSQIKMDIETVKIDQDNSIVVVNIESNVYDEYFKDYSGNECRVLRGDGYIHHYPNASNILKMNTRISIPEKKLEFINKLDQEHCSTEIYLQELKELHPILDETLGIIQGKFFFQGENFTVENNIKFLEVSYLIQSGNGKINFGAQDCESIQQVIQKGIQQYQGQTRRVYLGINSQGQVKGMKLTQEMRNSLKNAINALIYSFHQFTPENVDLDYIPVVDKLTQKVKEDFFVVKIRIDIPDPKIIMIFDPDPQIDYFSYLVNDIKYFISSSSK